MTGAAGTRELPVTAQMMQMLTGKWVSRAISCAAELGIADHLKSGEKSVEELAAATETHAPSLYRVLRALASVGVFRENGGRRFSMTPLADCLRSDAPDSLRSCALLYGMPAAWQAWADLTHCVRTGETGLKKAIGTENGFEYLAKNPDQAEVFDSAMTDYTRMCAPAIAAAYDFSRFKRLVDIAGGRGLLISTILRRYTGQLRGVLFDLPHVTEGAKLAVAAAGVADRCEVVAGDFFQGVPEGADGYMLKHIIHDWPEEQAVAILRNIKKAMAPAGRLLLLENVIPEGNEPSYGKWLDLQMMALPGGKERNAAEYAELLGKAGFRLTSITPTDAQISIVEAMPVVG